MSVAQTPANGSGRVRYVRGALVSEGRPRACHRRAVRSLMPAAAAATTIVCPFIRFSRYRLIWASVTIRPPRTNSLASPSRLKRTGQSNCRQPRLLAKPRPANLIVANHTPKEIQVLALSNALENGCRSCMALHSAFALKEGVSKDTVQALRAGRPPQEPRLQALSEFSRALVKNRGHVTADDLQKLLSAGYSKAQALEVVLGVAVSILPNFAHHITQCPIDERFRAHAWTTADVMRPPR